VQVGSRRIEAAVLYHQTAEAAGRMMLHVSGIVPVLPLQVDDFQLATLSIKIINNKHSTVFY